METSNHDDPLPFFDRLTDKRNYPNKSVKEVNPANKPTGPFTGRCKRCGSDDLWDDWTVYGCNNCGAVYRN